MKTGTLFIKVVFITCLAILSYFIYSSFFYKPFERLYNTKAPERRFMRHMIKATGSIQPEDMMKVGSIVGGIIEKMLVEENEVVAKGELLAIIDDGKGDTQVRSTKAAWESAVAKRAYLREFFKRQKALHAEKFISDDEFDQVTRDLQVAEADEQLRKADFDTASMIFEKKKLVAPEAGIVVGKNGTEGEGVTTLAQATVIYTLAKDIRKMEAKLEIDESNVSFIKKGMLVQLTCDTYLGQIFSGNISDVSNNPLGKSGTVNYLATVPINNSKLLFKPGMTIDAEIVVAEKENVLVVSGQQCSISPKTMKQVAQILGYEYKPLDSQQRLEMQKHGNHKVVWVERDKSFVECPITVGITDNAFFEVLEGITEQDKVVDDTIEENAMDKFFKKMFGGGLR